MTTAINSAFSSSYINHAKTPVVMPPLEKAISERFFPTIAKDKGYLAKLSLDSAEPDGGDVANYFRAAFQAFLSEYDPAARDLSTKVLSYERSRGVLDELAQLARSFASAPEPERTVSTEECTQWIAELQFNLQTTHHGVGHGNQLIGSIQRFISNPSVTDSDRLVEEIEALAKVLQSFAAPLIEQEQNYIAEAWKVVRRLATVEMLQQQIQLAMNSWEDGVGSLHVQKVPAEILAARYFDQPPMTATAHERIEVARATLRHIHSAIRRDEASKRILDGAQFSDHQLQIEATNKINGVDVEEALVWSRILAGKVPTIDNVSLLVQAYVRAGEMESAYQTLKLQIQDPHTNADLARDFRRQARSFGVSVARVEADLLEQVHTRKDSEVVKEQLGWSYLERGELSKAASIFSGLISEFPSSPSGYIGQAYIFERRSQIPEAHRALQLAARVGGSDTAGYAFVQAQILCVSGKRMDAAILIGKVLALDPLNQQLVTIASHWLNRSETETAKLMQVLVEQSKGRGIEQVAGVARIAASLRRHDEAIELYKSILSTHPWRSDFAVDAAMVSLAAQRKEDGLTFVALALQHNPGLPSAMRVRELLENGRDGEVKPVNLQPAADLNNHFSSPGVGKKDAPPVWLANQNFTTRPRPVPQPPPPIEQRDPRSRLPIVPKPTQVLWRAPTIDLSLLAASDPNAFHMLKTTCDRFVAASLDSTRREFLLQLDQMLKEIIRKSQPDIAEFQQALERYALPILVKSKLADREIQESIVTLERWSRQLTEVLGSYTVPLLSYFLGQRARDFLDRWTDHTRGLRAFIGRNDLDEVGDWESIYLSYTPLSAIILRVMPSVSIFVPQNREQNIRQQVRTIRFKVDAMPSHVSELSYRHVRIGFDVVRQLHELLHVLRGDFIEPLNVVMREYERWKMDLVYHTIREIQGIERNGN